MTQYPIAEVRERLKALLEKATPGPWKWVRHSEEDKPFYESEWRIAPGILTPDGSSGTPGGDEIDRANAKLVLEAVNALPALLAHLDAVEGENARLRAEGTSALIAKCAKFNVETAEQFDAMIGRFLDRAEAAESQLASQAASLAEMRAALERIAGTGQTIEPDHWKFRCMARALASTALQNKAES